MKPLIHHLLGETRAAVLAALFMRTEQALHVRELQRITGMSPGALHRELSALARYGLLLREHVGRQVLYRANTEHPLVPELAGLIRKTAGMVDVLRDALSPLENRVELAFVYGSMAKGAMHAHSDVDVMLVGTLAFSDAVLALQPAQESLRREINPTVMTRAQWRQKLAEPGSFVAAIWKQPKLWLKGDKDEPG
jgi:DNA-binding transcriptional ArsR family regulator